MREHSNLKFAVSYIPKLDQLERMMTKVVREREKEQRCKDRKTDYNKKKGRTTDRLI